MTRPAAGGLRPHDARRRTAGDGAAHRSWTAGQAAGSSTALERPGDQGFATVTVLALSAVLALLASVLVAVGTVAVLRSHVAAAADEATLAAAARAVDGRGPACARAATLTVAVGARLVACRLSGDLGDVAEVEVSVPAPGVLSRFGDVRGRARAGPALSGTSVGDGTR